MLRRWLCVSLLVASVDVYPSVQEKAEHPISPASQAASRQKAATPVAAVSVPAKAGQLREPANSKASFTNFDDRTDEKPVDWIARLVGIFGSLLGLGNVSFAIWKLKRDRKLSVEDDFWFRKIVAPVTIEPLLKSVMGLLHEMPTFESSPDTLAEYARKITTDFQKLYPAMKTLALIDSSWPELINSKLRDCEDVLTDHVGALSANDQLLSKSAIELQSLVLNLLNAALHEIKDGHLKK